jgi:hypothetical protein
MKRLLVLILVWTLLVVTGTLVSASGQALVTKSKNLISTQTFEHTEASNGIR